MVTVALKPEQINSLDLTPAQAVIEQWQQEETLVTFEQQLKFEISYPQDPEDQRELSEVPEVRLWFIRLDSVYPWLPFLLDWRSGELARYTAMLVPHQFSTREGIQYNPEALDIFIMNKVFVLVDWMKTQGISSDARLKSMAEMFGYELDTGLFALIQR